MNNQPDTVVESTTKLLPVLSPSGGPIQPSVPGAALHSIPTELGCSLQTVLALCAVITGLMRETLSQDAFRLAIRRAKTLALEHGDVSEEQWYAVEQVMLNHYAFERKRNPMHSMF